MRGRGIKPEYWRDRLLASLPAEIREFYVGLWMVADDAGWFRWQPDEIAADLYPYRSVKVRERQVRKWAERLAGLERIALLECGHGHIPAFRKHQRFTGGTRAVYVERDHLTTCLGESSLRTGTDRYVQVRKDKTGQDGTLTRPRQDPDRTQQDGVTPGVTPVCPLSLYLNLYRVAEALTGSPPTDDDKSRIDGMCKTWDARAVREAMLEDPAPKRNPDRFVGRVWHRLKEGGSA